MGEIVRVSCGVARRASLRAVGDHQHRDGRVAYDLGGRGAEAEALEPAGAAGADAGAPGADGADQGNDEDIVDAEVVDEDEPKDGESK